MSIIPFENGATGTTMPLPSLEPSEPTSVLLIEPDRTLSLTLQDLSFSLFRETLDLAMACALRDGMAYLGAHRVSLILISLAVSDYKGLDAVRVLRRTTP